MVHVPSESTKQRQIGNFFHILVHHLALEANFIIWSSMCSERKVTGRIFTMLLACKDIVKQFAIDHCPCEICSPQKSTHGDS